MDLQGFPIIRSMFPLFFLINYEFHKQNVRQYTRYFFMFMRGVSFGRLTGAVCDTVAQNKTKMIDSLAASIIIFMRGSRDASKTTCGQLTRAGNNRIFGKLNRKVTNPK